MKILITGICGFVGSTLAKYFLESNPEFEIFGMDNFSRAGSWLNKSYLNTIGIRVYHGDIRMASDLDILPKADWVIDAAANPSVLAGVDNRTSSLQLVQNNLSATINLLEYCKQHKAGFILLSTSRVYSIPDLCKINMEVVEKAFKPNENQQFPYGVTVQGINEKYSTEPPVSLYGCTKLASERLALEYGTTFGFPVWINRCGVMAGSGQFGHPGQGVFAYWVHGFKERIPLSYIGFGGKGYQVRDCLHPRDLPSLLIKQFKESLTSEKPRTINVSGGIKNTMSLAQVTSWCNDYFGVNYVIEGSDSVRPYDIPWVVLDNTKVMETWAWQPETGIEDVLLEIALFAKKHKDWCEMSLS